MSATPDHPISVILDDQTHERVEAWRKFFDAERPGSKTSRAAAIRLLIMKAGTPPKVKR